MRESTTINCYDHISYCFSPPFRQLQQKKEFNFDRTSLHYSPLSKDLDNDYLRNDWGVIAGRSFKILGSIHKQRIKQGLIIGTGIGLDALCFVEALAPDKLFITDLDIEIVNSAHLNIIRNVNSGINSNQIIPIESNLFSSENLRDTRFDIIFENLPNLPSSYKENSTQPMWGSFYYKKDAINNANVNRYLLNSHYDFLLAAKKYLKKDGGVVCNIGQRVPSKVIFDLFTHLNYSYKVLIYDFKCQNEALINIKAYAKFEQDNPGVKFNFYPYDKVLKKLTKYPYDKFSGYCVNSKTPDIEKDLSSLKISASRALELLTSSPSISIGHFYYSIYAQAKN